MNAKTTTTKQIKQQEQTRTTVENPDKQKNPQKKATKPQINKQLRGDTQTHVAASKPYPYIRKPKPAINLKNAQPSPNRRRQTGLKTPIKTVNPRLSQSKRLGSPNVNISRQSRAIGNSPALSNRVASEARVGNGGPSGIQGRLKKKSPWFSSIMEPIKGGGVKIPDPVGTDTGTFQHVENVSVAVGTNGVAGLRIISPYINNYKYGAADDEGSNYQVTHTEALTTDLQWSETQAAIPPGRGAMPFARVPAMMKATAQSHRIVSASLLAQPEVSTLADAGEMCAFVKPYDVNDSDVPYATLQSQWDSALMPVNAHKPLMARWYPVKSDYELFDTITSNPDAAGEPPVIGYDDFIDPNVIHDGIIADQGVIPWEIGIVCTGMTPSTGVVRFQIVVNYEFIPLTQNTMIDAQPSPIDPTEEQLVCSWVSDCPVTGVVSQKVASSAQEASTVAERSEPSGFGMIYNVVEEMMPLIKMGAKAFL